MSARKAGQSIKRNIQENTFGTHRIRISIYCRADDVCSAKAIQLEAFGSAPLKYREYIYASSAPCEMPASIHRLSSYIGAPAPHRREFARIVLGREMRAIPEHHEIVP